MAVSERTIEMVVKYHDSIDVWKPKVKLPWREVILHLRWKVKREIFSKTISDLWVLRANSLILLDRLLKSQILTIIVGEPAPLFRHENRLQSLRPPRLVKHVIRDSRMNMMVPAQTKGCRFGTL